MANASMQVKGWKIPSRETHDIPYRQIVNIIRERLSSLEQNIERRYLKPPLGVKYVPLNYFHIFMIKLLDFEADSVAMRIIVFSVRVIHI